MRKITLLFLILIISFSVYSQTEDKDSQNMEIIYSQDAYYPGGTLKLIEDVWTLMEYSEEAIAKRIDTEVMLSFDVQTDSSLSDIILLGKIGYGVDDDLKQVFEKLKFVPAFAQGKPIKMNVIMSIPIRTGPNSKRKTN